MPTIYQSPTAFGVISMYDSVDGDFGNLFTDALKSGQKAIYKVGDVIASGTTSAVKEVKKVAYKAGDVIASGASSVLKEAKQISNTAVKASVEAFKKGGAFLKRVSLKTLELAKKGLAYIQKLGKAGLDLLTKLFNQIKELLWQAIKKMAKATGILGELSFIDNGFGANLQQKAKTTLTELKCSFENHVNDKDIQAELAAEALGAIAAGLASASAGTAAAAAAMTARHGKAVIQKAVRGGQCNIKKPEVAAAPVPAAQPASNGISPIVFIGGAVALAAIGYSISKKKKKKPESLGVQNGLLHGAS
jgi:hypothetical protein